MSGNDIIDRAIDMERMSRDYYREVSQTSVREYAGEALDRLALEEQKHMDLLAEYRGALAAKTQVALPDASESDETWRGFTGALDLIREALHPHTDEITVIERAIGLENRGLVLYNEAQERTKSEEGRKVFAFLAEQETTHRAYLEKLLSRLMALYEEPPETRPQL